MLPYNNTRCSVSTLFVVSISIGPSLIEGRLLTPSSTMLKLFYDGNCPFCTAEMRRLKRWNVADRLVFVDVAGPDFDPALLGVDLSTLNRELHGQYPDGRFVIGTDAILAAYTLVGRGWLVAPLRIRLLRPLLAAPYRGFARNRYQISRLLGYRTMPACNKTSCRAIRF